MSSFGTFGACGSFISNSGGMRRDESRIGVGWTQEEDNQLLEEIGTKMDLKEIANIHKRTTKGIKLRLIHHAVKMMDTKGLNIETVAGHFNLLRSDIEDFRNKKTQEKKAVDFKNKKPEYHEKYLELLTDIRDTLKILVEKISEPTLPIIPTPPISPSSKKIIVKPINKISSLPKITSEQSFFIESNKATAPHSPVSQHPPSLSPLNHKQIDSPDISLKMPLPKLKVDV
jgi:hypothetical protein